MNIRKRFQDLTPPQKITWLIVIWMTLLSVLWIWWDERTLPDIRGSWASAECEELRGPEGTTRLKRVMEIDETDWSLKIDFYGEEGCAKELFSVRIEGSYDIGPKSMGVRDATTARFDLRELTLTPRTPEAVAAFDAAGCAGGGWKVGEAQDVTQLGCLDLVPTAATCPTEYDIVKVEGDALHLGDRSQGLCVPERYPKEFASTPLYRLENSP